MDLQSWKEAITNRLRDSAHFLKERSPGTLYGMLAASSLLPVISAYNGGDPSSLIALGSVVGSVGGNLLANQLQGWKDRSEAELAADLDQLAAANPVGQETLDAILTQLETPRIVQNILAEADKDWFTRTLRQELTALGNLERYQQFFTSNTATQSGSGAVAQGKGAVAAGAGGVAVGGDVHGDVNVNNQLIDPAAPDSASLETAYLSHLFTQMQALSLGGVDPKLASDAQVRLSLNAVYTALLTEQVEGEGEGRMGLRPDARTRRISALEQIDRHPRLVLLGDPGSGKSTFVNFVALCLAGERLGRREANLALLREPLPDSEQPPPQPSPAAGEGATPPPQPWAHGPLLPVRVVLRDFAARGLPPAGEHATARHLWDFIQTELAEGLGEFGRFLRKHLRERGGLLLLDGLDEVPEADQRRGQIKEAVEGFATLFPRCRILVTSRTYAYQRQEWQLNDFQPALLAPFSPGQIERFVQRWYAHIGPMRHWSAEDTQGRAAVLQRAIRNSERLAELAERPLLLTLMASLHAWRGGSLPERREDLYNDAVELLLDWWESQRVVRDAKGNTNLIQPSLAEWLKVDRARVRGLLNRLAYDAHAGQSELVGTADIAEATLIDELLALSQNPDARPRRLVEYLSQRAGLLVPRGNAVYTFPHRTFQEYLAACHLTDNDFPDVVAELARTEPGRWREVALLAGAKAGRGTASAIWSLADALCYREAADPTCTDADLWGAQLAGQALAESIDPAQTSPRNRAKLERVKGGLIHLLGSGLPALERARAGRTLAFLGDPRAAVMTVTGMDFCAIPPGPFVMGSVDESETPQNWGKETPQHPLNIPYTYWMGRYPVTNAQYAEFVAGGGYGRAELWPEAIAAKRWEKGQVRVWDYDLRTGQILRDKWRSAAYDFGEPFNLPNHPAVGVSWYESLAFCRWLSERLRGAGHLPADWEVALPSEAEWEKAARGGLEIPAPSVGALFTTPAAWEQPAAPLRANPHPARRYPWGDDPDPQRANYAAADIASTNSPGAFPAGASPYGVEELSGGIFEWTRTLWGENWQKSSFDYPYQREDGREELSATDQTLRVVRGGFWSGDAAMIRASARYRSLPYDGLNYFGFRLVCVPLSRVPGSGF